MFHRHGKYIHVPPNAKEHTIIFSTIGKGETGPAGPQGEKGDKGDTGSYQQMTIEQKQDMANFIIQNVEDMYLTENHGTFTTVSADTDEIIVSGPNGVFPFMEAHANPYGDWEIPGVLLVFHNGLFLMPGRDYTLQFSAHLWLDNETIVVDISIELDVAIEDVGEKVDLIWLQARHNS